MFLLPSFFSFFFFERPVSGFFFFFFFFCRSYTFYLCIHPSDSVYLYSCKKNKKTTNTQKKSCVSVGCLFISVNLYLKRNLLEKYTNLKYCFSEQQWRRRPDIDALLVAVPPTLRLELGKGLNPNDIEEGDNVYFECHVNSNPPAYKVVWKHNVSKVTRRAHTATHTHTMD